METVDTVERVEIREQLVISTGKRCSDFDEDCEDIKDKMNCFMNPIIGMADGYCPYIYTTVTKNKNKRKQT